MALDAFHAWKDRYLLLVYEMRRTSIGKLDRIREEIALIRQRMEARKVLINQALIEIETTERILPDYYERVNSSARVLLKAYRESAFLGRKDHRFYSSHKF